MFQAGADLAKNRRTRTVLAAVLHFFDCYGRHLPVFSATFNLDAMALFILAVPDDLDNLGGGGRVEKHELVVFCNECIATFDTVAGECTLFRMGFGFFEEVVTGVFADARNVEDVPFEDFTVSCHSGRASRAGLLRVRAAPESRLPSALSSEPRILGILNGEWRP